MGVLKLRPSKARTYMGYAEVAAKRSHDTETQVGSSLIRNDNGSLIATGCNGFARGVADEKLPTTRPLKYKYIIHSEENLVANCAYNGISMANCTLYCTLSPCTKCMRLLYQAGITCVVAKTKYKDFDDILQMDDLNIKEELMEEGYVKLTYSPKT